ncbi:MAG TPA: DUF3501 family protein [Rhizomicrobium sp.]|nr:DUF3501 family protein [Rhizomicrobium sp.]
MTANEHRITRADILSSEKFAAGRAEFRRRLIPAKKNRRVETGPFATFYFENYDTMWLQVQEMLHIEKGGDAQIDGELETYNPLIPQGRELIATLMLEIEDPVRRSAMLLTLAGIEERVSMDVAGLRIRATPTEYEDRTTPDGKTSSVHWVRFSFTLEAVGKFRSGEGRVVLEIDHPGYGHMAVLSPDVRAELAKDFKQG